MSRPVSRTQSVHSAQSLKNLPQQSSAASSQKLPSLPPKSQTPVDASRQRTRQKSDSSSRDIIKSTFTLVDSNKPPPAPPQNALRKSTQSLQTSSSNPNLASSLPKNSTTQAQQQQHQSTEYIAVTPPKPQTPKKQQPAVAQLKTKSISALNASLSSRPGSSLRQEIVSESPIVSALDAQPIKTQTGNKASLQDENPFADPPNVPMAPKPTPPKPLVHKSVAALNEHEQQHSRVPSAQSRHSQKLPPIENASHSRQTSAASSVYSATLNPLSYDAQAIKVAVRIRDVQSFNAVTSRPGTPASDHTENGTPPLCMNLKPGSNRIDMTDPKESGKGLKSFNYDTVFGMDVTQDLVYSVAVEPLIRKCLQGYNGCIFAYGQTASGKTHTMQGPASHIPESFGANTQLHPDIGIISRVVHQISDHVKKIRGTIDEASGNCVDFVVKVSYLEIYNESLIDLLIDKDKQETLKIRMEPDSTTGKDLYVQNLSERYINNLHDYLRILTTGAKNRSVGETNMNEASSRSHAILTITIDQYLVETSRRSRNVASADFGRAESVSSLAPEHMTAEMHSPEELQKIGMGRKRSKIHLIDLAGSERADSTGATGIRLKEGSQINQSLSALGNVISALTSHNSTTSTHIPYRDSKLTYLLSDSLGGNALTLMITCCSPTAKNYSESMSTLRFAERVKKVVNRAIVNMDPYLLRIAELEAEVLRLKRLLDACTCGGGGNIPVSIEGDGLLQKQQELTSSENQTRLVKQNDLVHKEDDLYLPTVAKIIPPTDFLPPKKSWWTMMAEKLRNPSAAGGCCISCGVGKNRRIGIET
ncbi:hypothetical protein HK100_002589, partial [Physocladia obscura]